MAKLERPLDWVAVTDHSDGMGAISEMRAGNPEFMADPRIKKMARYDGPGPRTGDGGDARAGQGSGHANMPKPFMDEKWVASAWQKTVDIMEKYNEPGKFTAFISYEWTSNADGGENLHRNVIFRDNADKTRALTPLTTWASGDPATLWAWLANYEATTGGRVLAIPHNGNLSNGRMFEEQQYDGKPLTREWAEARARWEPVYELFQFKGRESHPACRRTTNSPAPRSLGYRQPRGPHKTARHVQDRILARGAEIGHAPAGNLGNQPVQAGRGRRHRTHTGMSTADENNFWGKLQIERARPRSLEPDIQKEQSYVRKDWTLAAAGNMGVWATANTREALWDAMKRRETYATSGPRMTVRFFGGYGFSDADAKGDPGRQRLCQGRSDGRRPEGGRGGPGADLPVRGDEGSRSAPISTACRSSRAGSTRPARPTRRSSTSLWSDAPSARRSAARCRRSAIPSI